MDVADTATSQDMIDEQVLALQNGIITLPCVLKLRPLCLRPNSRTLGSIIDDRQLMREALRLNMARELGLDTNILSLATPPKHTQYGVRILKVLLPNLRDLRTPYLVFTSELLPRSFGSQKRLDIIRILRSKAAYVSACMSMPRTFSNMQYRVSYRGTSATSSPFIAPPGPSGRGWPDGNVPTEVIHNIASYLSRYDLLELRLVNHEFERKVSSLVFVSTTAAFRPQIYNGTPRDTELVDVKGKGKAKGRQYSSSFGNECCY